MSEARTYVLRYWAYSAMIEALEGWLANRTTISIQVDDIEIII